MKTYLKILVSLLLFSAMSVALGGGALVTTAQQEDNSPLATGAQLYAENCAVCHGENGEGRIGATLAVNWPSIRPELATRATIAAGVPGSAMPAWSQAYGGPLSQEQIEALVVYILSWQTGGAPETTPLPTAINRPTLPAIPNVQGDPNRGALLYDQNCAVCHGPNGTGRIGATIAKNWPSVRPDLTIKSTIAGGGDSTLMPAWSQAYGGPLSEADIDDIVAYILSWQVSGEPQTPAPVPTVKSPWSGWGGVVMTVLLFILIVALILSLQKLAKE